MKNNIKFYSSIPHNKSLNIIPAVIYSNAKEQKRFILNENRGKCGIYC